MKHMKNLKAVSVAKAETSLIKKMKLIIAILVDMAHMWQVINLHFNN